MLVVDPMFWLGLSILLVAVSLVSVLVVAIPTFRDLGRAARSAEKLFDTLHRELPPTLESIRLTSLEITDLTDDVSEGVQHAGQIAKQVDQSFHTTRKQVQKAQVTSRSFFSGMRVAWQTWSQSSPPDHLHPRPPRLASSAAPPMGLSRSHPPVSETMVNADNGHDSSLPPPLIDGKSHPSDPEAANSPPALPSIKGEGPADPSAPLRHNSFDY